MKLKVVIDLEYEFIYNDSVDFLCKYEHKVSAIYHIYDYKIESDIGLCGEHFEEFKKLYKGNDKGHNDKQNQRRKINA